MPLTAKGEEIKHAMKQEYGAEKGEQVFAASKNAGTITGVDEKLIDAELSQCGPLTAAQVNENNRRYWEPGGGASMDSLPATASSPTASEVGSNEAATALSGADEVVEMDCPQYDPGKK